MKKLEKIYFLIHGFCYAEMLGSQSATALEINNRHRPYLERENNCAENWRRNLTDFSDIDALIVIPGPGGCGTTLTAYVEFAQKILGDRCFVLDCPDSLTQEFWSRADSDFREALLHELRAAFVEQKLNCNAEELATNLHCLACCRRFESMLQERGFSIDKSSVAAEGWGASFDGCVTKYTVSLRRLLGLSRVIDINYRLTVPDAAFLVNVTDAQCVVLPNGLRSFLFRAAHGPIALYTLTTHSLADWPVLAVLPRGLTGSTIKSKQGIRLWPQPQTYELSDAPFEYREPAQNLVHVHNGCLSIPVSTGFVYRLAKAPAYIFAPEGMADEEFRALLMTSELLEITR